MPRISPFVALLAALALAAQAAAATPPPRPAKLGLCAACHGEDGRSRTSGTPHLAGQDEAYLRYALAAYRAGDRHSPPMNAVAGALQSKDIKELARWFATRPAAPK